MKWGFFKSSLTAEQRAFLTLQWLKTCVWSRITEQVTHTPEAQGNHLASSAPRWVGGLPPKDGSDEGAYTGLLSCSPYSASAADTCFLLNHVQIFEQSHGQCEGITTQYKQQANCPCYCSPSFQLIVCAFWVPMGEEFLKVKNASFNHLSFPG